MNTASPYVRPHLKATQEGIPDPRVLVEAWLDRLELVSAFEPANLSEQHSYDLLAMWAKLQRVRPELIGSDDARLISQAAAALDQYGQQLAKLALTVPNPDAWQHEAERLDDLHEETDDPLMLNTLAEELIEQLDDAELLLYAAAKQGVSDEQLAGRIDDCRDWLMRHANRFVAASVYIQAAGMTLRPDLAESDYDLALTALKYEALLDAIEDAEAELQMQQIVPLPAELAEAVRKRLELDRIVPPAEPTAEAAAPAAPGEGPHIDATLAFPRSVLPQAKLAAQPQESAGPRILQWRSPRHGRYAAAAVPEASAKQFILAFFNADGSPAADLAGTAVRLAGVEAVISSDGTCTFALNELLESMQDLKLEVGPDHTVWEAVAD